MEARIDTQGIYDAEQPRQSYEQWSEATVVSNFDREVDQEYLHFLTPQCIA